MPLLFDQRFGPYLALPAPLSHVWITPHITEDEDAFLDINTNVPDVKFRSYSAPVPFTREVARKRIQQSVEAAATVNEAEEAKEESILSSGVLRVIRDSTTGKLLGGMACWDISADRATVEIKEGVISADHATVEVKEGTRIYVIGYNLHPDHRGKGIMVAAVKSLVEFYVPRNKIELLIAYAEGDNPQSQSVLVKAGFTKYAENVPLAWPESKGGGFRNFDHFSYKNAIVDYRPEEKRRHE